MYEGGLLGPTRPPHKGEGISPTQPPRGGEGKVES